MSKNPELNALRKLIFRWRARKLSELRFISVAVSTILPEMNRETCVERNSKLTPSENSVYCLGCRRDRLFFLGQYTFAILVLFRFVVL